MKELFKHYKNYIFVLIIPYLVLMFLLVTPINFHLYSPGGLTEVESLIEVDYNQDKEIEGTISSTYIMSIKRPTYFQFILGTLSDYSSISVLNTYYQDYTNDELNQISYLDKAVSVDSAIIVAYEAAKLNNPEIVINYDIKTMVYGKATYLDYYDDIAFGDEFISLLGDGDYLVTEVADFSTYTQNADSYEFTFKNENGETYTRTLSKDENTGKFGITLKTYYLVDKSSVYPMFTENPSNIGGPSGGLLQTLSIYNKLIDNDLTNGLKIAGTGTINYDGSVGYIGGVEQKILTAYLNNVDLFFIPSLDEEYFYDNYQEAIRVCEKYGINPDGFVIPVSTFQEAVDYLEAYNG